MARTVTIIDSLKRRDELPQGPVLPVATGEQISLSTFPKDHWAPGYPPQPLLTATQAIEYLGGLLVSLVQGNGTPTLPITYTSTQTYTATCGAGLQGTPVSRLAVRTSTVSQAEADSLALAAATQLALSTLVCTPVTVTYTSTRSYTTTVGDYTTKCGAGTSGSSVTRSATRTSTTSQAAADQAALQEAQAQAIAAITCPLVPVVYNTFLPNPTTGSQVADGMSVVPPTTETLNFDLINGTSGPTVSIAITSLGGTTYIDYASEYSGKPYVFQNSGGTKFSGTLPASDNLSISY